MTLISNWRLVIARAWSVRLILIAALLDAIAVALAVFSDDPPIGRAPFAAASFAVTLGAALARIIAQPDLHGDDA